MYDLLDRLKDPMLCDADVITWGSPVPSFGNLETSKLATLGLNPSNKEFVDNYGNELDGDLRRFHTLSSLGISEWSEIENVHLNSILDSCTNYFNRNPYDGWFKRLDYLISGTSMSYYFPSSQACHLDLVPYATASKWTDLTSEQKTNLLHRTGDLLGILLKNSQVNFLILNGRTVIEHLRKISNAEFQITLMPEWTLPRKNGNDVEGFAYSGELSNIGGVELSRTIKLLGFNHNIQSSYGVTTKVQTSIRNWISENVEMT